LLIAVTLAKHLKFNGFKNFAGLGLEPRVLSRNNLFLMRSCKFRIAGEAFLDQQARTRTTTNLVRRLNNLGYDVLLRPKVAA